MLKWAKKYKKRANIAHKHVSKLALVLNFLKNENKYLDQ
jgi:hypothetical protein